MIKSVLWYLFWVVVLILCGWGLSLDPYVMSGESYFEPPHTLTLFVGTGFIAALGALATGFPRSS